MWPPMFVSRVRRSRSRRQLRDPRGMLVTPAASEPVRAKSGELVTKGAKPSGGAAKLRWLPSSPDPQDRGEAGACGPPIEERHHARPPENARDPLTGRLRNGPR